MFFRKKKCGQGRHLVILGAGKFQEPLIHQALELGFHTIAVDRDSLATALHLNHLKIIESVTASTEIIGILDHEFFTGPLAGCITRSFGEAVLSASIINEHLGTPHLDSASARDLLNKQSMKNMLMDNQVPMVPTLELNLRSKKKIREAPYPLVVKPVTGHGKAGVKLVQKSTELEQELKNKGKHIIEPFIDGPEIIAIGLVHQETFHLLLVSDKEKTPLPHFVDLKHSAPSRYMDRAKEITELGQKVAQAFNITSSPLVMELLVTTEGMILIEAVPEFGGEFICDYMIQQVTGLSLFELAIKSLTGCKLSLPAKPPVKKSVVIQYLSYGPGKVTGAVVPTKWPRGIIHGELFCSTGDKLQKLENNHHRAGVIIGTGRTAAKAQERIDQALHQVTVTVN